MKKKLISFTLILFILCSQINIEATSVGYNEDIYNKANRIIESILNENIFASKPLAKITRAEFVSAVVKVFKMEGLYGGISKFTDIEHNPHYDAINIAVSLNWIVDGEFFYPNRSIKTEEAVKIIVCATGYDYLVEYQGGYPLGYLTVANNNKLLSNVKSDTNNDLTTENGMILIYNMLNMNYLRIDSYSDDAKYTKENKNYLAELYNLYKITGIITSTTYNSLSFDYKIELNNIIRINGKEFFYGEMKADMLGKRVEAYFEDVEDDIKNIVCVIPERNDEIIIGFDEAEGISDNVFVYFDNETSRKKTVSLSDMYITIYNGRRIENTTNEIFDKSSGEIRLLDNSNNGKYDIVFVDSFEYMQIESVDIDNESIGAKGDYFNLNVEGGFYEILTSEGKALRIFELNTSDLIAVKTSQDNMLTKIILCSDGITGTITSLVLDEKIIYIDGNPYKLSEYFLNKYGDIIEVGSNEVFYLGIDDIIVSKGISVSDFRYGYLMEIALSNNLHKKLQMKILTDKGEMKVYDVLDKVVVDGEDERLSSNQVYKFLTGGKNGFERQLIRYLTNSNGKIYKLDFAEDATDESFGKEFQNDNKLIKHEYMSSLLYRGNIRGFPPHYNVVRSIIFKIPFDADDVDGYEVIGNLSLADASKYHATAYNIGLDGGAEAVVVQNSEKIALTYHDNGFIIESINAAINSEGEYGKNLYVWSQGVYDKFFLSDEIDVKKASGKELSTGDVVRMKYDKKNEISEIVVDFDASEGVFEGNEAAGGALINGGNHNLTYQVGKVYSFSNSFVYVSNVKDGFGKYDFSFGNLRNFYVNTTNIVRYDMETGQLRTIKANEIKTYLSYGENASYVVIRQRGFWTESVFVYE